MKCRRVGLVNLFPVMFIFRVFPFLFLLQGHFYNSKTYFSVEVALLITTRIRNCGEQWRTQGFFQVTRNPPPHLTRENFYMKLLPLVYKLYQSKWVR